MSDHGDYKEPKAGDWMLVIERGGDVVDCLRVANIDDVGNGPVAMLSDCSMWGAETGQPIQRKWKDHYLWPCSKGDEYTDAMEMLAAASPDAFGEVYGILLADKRSKPAWTPAQCVHCSALLPGHTTTCSVVHAAAEDGISTDAFYEREYGTPEKIAWAAAIRLGKPAA